MALDLNDLDERTRSFMLRELNDDLNNGRLYLSGRLSQVGRQDYPELLRQAIEKYDDDWLSHRLQEQGRVLEFEERVALEANRRVKVPKNATQVLAEGEFNRYYIRALCLVAQEEGARLIIYRARSSSSPRPESQALIGSEVNASNLLDDLRTHIGIETALGLPSGPNSGLSVQISR